MNDAAGLKDMLRDRKFPKARAAGMALFVLCMCTAASSGQKSGEAENQLLSLVFAPLIFWVSEVRGAIQKGSCPLKMVYCGFKRQASQLYKYR
jgi:hypothetical protein